MADEDAELPVMTLMFCTTLATIYLSYVFWLGVTHPWKAWKVVTNVDPSDLSKSHPSNEVMLRIQERRYDVWSAGMALSAFCAEVFCIFVICSALVSGGSLMDTVFNKFRFWTAFTSAACARYSSKPNRGAKMSSQETFIVTSFMCLLGLVNSIDLSNHFMPANYMGRVFVGCFSPDLNRTVWLNVWCIPFSVICTYLREDENDISMLPLFILNEVISVTFMAVVLGHLNYLTIKQEEKNMELEENVQKQDLHIKETEAVLNAAKSLLAVMCDCCEQLSHDWTIVHPSNQVLEMFRFPDNMRKERPSSFSLAHFIAIEDRERFTAFISTSHVNAPSSLHLEMKDFHGTSFDVQIFHMPVPSLLTEEPQHLVGIIKKETFVPARVVRRARDIIPSIPEDATLDEDMGASSSSDDVTSIHSRGTQRLSIMREEDNSPGSRNSKHYENSIDHVRISLDLHTGPTGYSVQKMVIAFKEGASEQPTLFSCLKRRYRVLVEDWLQEHVNSWYYGILCDETCRGTKLSIPLLGHLVVGEMNVVDIQCYQDQFTLDVEMKNFVSD